MFNKHIRELTSVYYALRLETILIRAGPFKPDI